MKPTQLIPLSYVKTLAEVTTKTIPPYARPAINLERQITDETIKALVNLLTDVNCPKNLWIDLGYIKLPELKKLNPLFDALTCESAEKIGLSLNLTDEYYPEAIQELIQFIHHPKRPNDLCLIISPFVAFLNNLNTLELPMTFYFKVFFTPLLSKLTTKIRHNDFSPGTQFTFDCDRFHGIKCYAIENLKNVLLTHTEVGVYFKTKPSDSYLTTDQIDILSQQIDIIHFCSLRNKLIQAYPQFAPLIKKISADHDLYFPSTFETKPPSLLCQSMKFLTLHPQQGMYARLPRELKAYMNELKGIKNWLEIERRKTMR